MSFVMPRAFTCNLFEEISRAPPVTRSNFKPLSFEIAPAVLSCTAEPNTLVPDVIEVELSNNPPKKLPVPPTDKLLLILTLLVVPLAERFRSIFVLPP